MIRSPAWPTLLVYYQILLNNKIYICIFSNIYDTRSPLHRWDENVFNTKRTDSRTRTAEVEEWCTLIKTSHLTLAYTIHIQKKKIQFSLDINKMQSESCDSPATPDSSRRRWVSFDANADVTSRRTHIDMEKKSPAAPTITTQSRKAANYNLGTLSVNTWDKIVEQ